MKKSIFIGLLALCLIAPAPAAEAHGHHHHGADALAAGLLGLGLGLAITAPRTYYYSDRIYYDEPVVIERRYVAPRRIYRWHYRDYDWYPRRHHHHHHHHWDD